MKVQKINAMEVAKELEKYLDTFDYGIIVDNKKYMYDNGIPEELFDSYSTYTVDEFENNKIGTCWDFANYQSYIFSKNHIDNENYLFFGKKTADIPDEDAITHTFTIFSDSSKEYWFESAMYPKKGIHEITSVKDVIDELIEFYGIRDKNTVSVWRYHPSQFYFNHWLPDDFVNEVTSDEINLVYDNFGD